MKNIIAICLLLTATLASANDLDKIAGKYNYDQYSVRLSDGRILGLNDLGARGATIEINRNTTLILKMYMLDGNIITTKASIKEIKINGNNGYWIAKWPDMNYTDRVDFSFNDTVIQYINKFQNKNDPLRYGSVEKAVLTKISM